MSVTQIATQSSPAMLLAVNTLLRLSLKPELAAEGSHLYSSRRSMDRWGRSLPPIAGVAIKAQRLADIPCEVHIPQHSRSNQVMLYFHGGGFAVGSLVSHRRLVSRIARASGIKAICIHYRRAPEHPFPAAQEDIIKIYRHCLDQGIKPSNIVFCGDSAGGNLVLTSLLRLKEQGLPLPAGASCISPWCDLMNQADTIQQNANRDFLLSASILRQFADCYAPEDQRKNPLVSPVYGNLTDLPPLLLQVGSSEILLGDAITFTERAQTAGVDVQLEIWDQMQHVWHYSALVLQDGRRAVQHIAAFFMRVLGTAA